MNAKISIALLITLLISSLIAEPKIDIKKAFCPISLENPLGCSALGEDFLQLLISASGGTLIIALLGRILSIFLSLFSSITGFLLPLFWFYHLLAQALLTIPVLFLAVLLRNLWKTHEISLLLSLAVAEWALSHEWLSKRIYDHKQKTFCEASFSLGANKFFLLKKHILPYLWHESLILFFVYFPNSLLTLSALEFLGFSQNTAYSGLGYLVAVGKDYLFYKPELAMLPALFLTIMVFLSLSLKKKISNELS